ncbi:MAG: type II secretion system F family protein [Candidatus Magnetomorum sp.]|nr:type II secretion system F family protein [Candidatus Magnetomorum sp.]
MTIGTVISMLFGISVFFIFAGLYWLLKDSDPIEQRLNIVACQQRPLKRVRHQPSFKRMISTFFTQFFPRSNDNWEKSKIRSDLIKAGYRTSEAFGMFMGIRMISLIALPAGTLTLLHLSERSHGEQLAGLFMALIFGFLLPGYFLEKKVGARGYKLGKELPDVLDLLVIAVESGLGLDAAVKRVARELIHSCPILAEELTLMSLEIKVGIPRDKALKNLSDRCGVDEINSMTATLIQSDRFGVGVGRALRVHSEEVRTKRRQQLEEAAAKIPLKLLFPVLFLIFPAIMAVMAGPAVIKIMESMF